jgi:hypothetical protein
VKRLRLVAAVVAGICVAAMAVAMASLASAAAPSPGTCTDSFILISDKQLAKLLTVNTLADIQALDKNSNGYVCYKQGGNSPFFQTVDDKV